MYQSTHRFRWLFVCVGGAQQKGVTAMQCFPVTTRGCLWQGTACGTRAVPRAGRAACQPNRSGVSQISQESQHPQAQALVCLQGYLLTYAINIVCRVDRHWVVPCTLHIHDIFIVTGICGTSAATCGDNLLHSSCCVLLLQLLQLAAQGLGQKGRCPVDHAVQLLHLLLSARPSIVLQDGHQHLPKRCTLGHDRLLNRSLHCLQHQWQLLGNELWCAVNQCLEQVDVWLKPAALAARTVKDTRLICCRQRPPGVLHWRLPSSSAQCCTQQQLQQPAASGSNIRQSLADCCWLRHPRG